jgi:2-haloacid dehalogenase
LTKLKAALGRFDSYTNITKNSFQHALTETGVSLSQEEVEQVMVGYDSLSAFPDVPPALQRIRKSLHITPVIFSNGQNTMVNNSVMHSADLSPHAEIFQDIMTVDDVQRYKPTPEVYFYLAEKVGKQRTQLSELWLVSGNPFDITGAKNAGLRAAWVDRAGIGWRDRMIEDGVPDVSAKSLEDLMVEIEKHVQ